MKKNRAKKLTWDACSKYVRLKYADNNGYVKCYTCGKTYYWKQIQAGHGLSGRCLAILYETDLLRPQCYGCNICNSGKLDEFVRKLRQYHGDERMEELFELKNQKKNYTIEEYEDLKEWFKDNTDWWKNVEN